MIDRLRRIAQYSVQTSMPIWHRIYYLSRVAFLTEYLRSWNMPNAVFIWIPKTAGTSLFSTLNAPKLKKLYFVKYGFCGRGTVTFGHMDYSQLVERGHISKSFDESAYKFTFVRNPYSRAVSLHSFLYKDESLPVDKSFLIFCRRLRENGCEPIGLYNVRGLSQCNPQVRWIENTKINYIGKVESINEDVSLILENLGLPLVPVPELNTTAHSNYSDCYCRESKEIVEEFYKEDFESFNYPYEEFFEDH